jgi:hypothetical protein
VTATLGILESIEYEFEEPDKERVSKPVEDENMTNMCHAISSETEIIMTKYPQGAEQRLRSNSYSIDKSQESKN